VGTAKVCKLHHIDVGSRAPDTKPPIIILHGLFGEGKNFQSWAKGLGADYDSRRIILVDLRNHGSSEHAPTMSYREMAADVIALLDSLGLDEIVLCGHSLGGKVSMATALMHPARVERLLVLDMAPAVYEEVTCTAWAEIREVLGALDAVDLASCATKREVESLLAPSIANAEMRAFALTNVVKGAGGALRWRINLPAIVASLAELGRWEGLEGLTYNGNTLFVGGGKSRFIRTEHMPLISEQFTCYSFSRIRDAAHWIHAETPKALLLVASNFLDVDGDLCGARYDDD